MKKIDKIDCCLNCPLREVNLNRKGSHCNHPETEGTEVFSLLVVPEWCPLPEDI